MINRIYENIIKFIRNNLKGIIGLIGLYILVTFPLPYYIYTSGGIINVDKKVSISGESNKKGSFNFSYVNELRGTIPTLLLSFVISDWDVINPSNIKSDNESMKDAMYRDKMLLEESKQNAVKVAYTKANNEIKTYNQRHYVVFISNKSITNLSIKDELLEVNNTKINSVDDYRSIVNNSNIGDKLVLKVRTNNKIDYKEIKVIDYMKNKTTGIYVVTLFDYVTTPNIKLNFNNNESGPSGGLMLSLTIYNKLIKENINKGLKIVGTGTIDSEGNVGTIGGIEYKLKGAVKSKGDIFFVPLGENYDDAIKIKKKKHYVINIIGVATFDDALKYLSTL